MHGGSVRKFLIASGVALVCCCLWLSQVAAQVRIGPLDYRDYDLDDLEITNPGAITYAAKNNLFFIVQAGTQQQIRIFTVTPYELLVDTFEMDIGELDIGELEISEIEPGEMATGTSCPSAGGHGVSLQLAYDGQKDRLLILDPTGQQIIALATGPEGLIDRTAGIVRFDVAGLADVDVGGVAAGTSAGGQMQLLLLDSTAREVLHIAPDAAGSYDLNAAERVGRLELDITNEAQLRGLAYEEWSGHYFTVDMYEETLYELDSTGQTLVTYDLYKLGLINLAGLVSAPTADGTDDPSTTDLFLTDPGLQPMRKAHPAGAGAGAVEDATLNPLIPRRIAWGGTQPACSIPPAYKDGRFTELYLKAFPRTAAP